MWHISNLDNSVQLSKKQALILAKDPDYLRIVGDFYKAPDFASEEEELEELFIKEKNKYYMIFNPDHMEHMDYVSEVSQKLQSIKAKGDITFGSEDGDNAGSYWGYRFDGKGGMKELVGVVHFVEAQ